MRALTFIPGLARRSVRGRVHSLGASALVLALGTMISLAFATLVDSAGAAGVSPDDHDTLMTVGAVVGGWAALIVAVAIGSTVGPAVSRRAQELTLLRRLGLSRRQTERLVVTETALTALAAALVAVVPGVLLGRAVLAVLGAGVVDGGVPFTPHASTVALVVAGVVALATGAARFSVRRAAARTETARERGLLTRGRKIVAGVCLVIAVNGTIMTVADGSGGSATDAMSTCGSSSVVASIGLALLAPAIVRRVGRRIGGPGVAMFLAGRDAERRAGALSAILTPIVAFVGIAAGTLYMIAVDHADGAHVGGGVELINYLVTGMICVFAAIMVAAAIVAAVADRRRELGLLQLAGVSAAQARTTIMRATALLAGLGVGLGLIASLATSVAYAAVRPDGWQPLAAIAIDAGVAVAAVALVLGVAARVTRAATATSPAATVAGAAAAG